MKVQLKTTRAGPGGCNSAGSIIDVSPLEAEALITGRFAVPVKEPPPAPPPKPDDDIETTAKPPPPEQTVRRGPGRPRKDRLDL